MVLIEGVGRPRQNVFGGNLALPVLLHVSFAFGVDRVERNNLQSNEETVPNLDASRPPEMIPFQKSMTDLEYQPLLIRRPDK
jgi:hypothetical protein